MKKPYRTIGPQSKSCTILTKTRLPSFAGYLAKPLLAALILASLDSTGLLITQGSIDQSILVLLLFLEAGAGLLVGVGISLSSTPTVSKIGHTVLGTAEWSRESERHAEGVGWKWMIASGFLFLLGIVLSVA